MKTLRLFAFALILVTSGCQLLLADVAANFDLKLEPAALSVARGGSGTLKVTISRTVPIDVVPVPITLELYNPPAGVSAEALEFPSGISEDDLRVEVDESAVLGGPVTLKVRATNGLNTKEATFKLTITSAQ